MQPKTRGQHDNASHLVDTSAMSRDLQNISITTMNIVPTTATTITITITTITHILGHA